MNWLDDANIEAFLDSAILRIEMTQVYRTGVTEAWVILSADSRTYLGTVTRTGRKWNAFTVKDPRGTRVSDFFTAIQLVVLTAEAEETEGVLGVETQEER